MSAQWSSDPHINDMFRRASLAVKVLVNTDLKRICKDHELPVSGVKATLQSRIIERLRTYAIENDEASLADLSRSISPHTAPVSNPAYTPTASFVNKSSTSSAGMAYAGSYGHTITYKSDLLRTIVRPVSRQLDLPPLPHSQQTVGVPVTLDQTTLDALKDGKHRLMVYSSCECHSQNPNVTFPNNVRLEVNQNPYEKNLRAIKKKSGGPVNPADITDLVRKQLTYENRITVTYGHTNQKYSTMVYLIRKNSIDGLVAKIRSGSLIPKATTIASIRRNQEDSDIQATSWDLPLKDPATGMRIKLPVKTPACTHVQCFDAEGFFMLQEQSPQMHCPTCSKPIRDLKDLAVDEYMADILKNVHDNVDQIIINPDGSWKIKGPQTQPQPKKKQRMSYSLDDDEDEKPRSYASTPKDSVVAPTPPTSSKPMFTSMSNSREPSSATSAAPSTGSKRKASAVVDLTLSSDEDDDPSRPAVRQASSNGVNGIQNSLPKASPSIPAMHPLPQRPPSYEGLSFGHDGAGYDASAFHWSRG